MLVFNNTKVIRARIIMHKPSGARIEVFCLEPHAPADYERAFAVKGKCAWSCIVGNLKKWKEGALVIDFTLDGTPQQLRAYRTAPAAASRSCGSSGRPTSRSESCSNCWDGFRFRPT